MDFQQLHQENAPLLICNVWDVQSAKIAQNLGFDPIGTSSGAIASMLGYQDGEEISFREVAYLVERITKSVDLPLTVDLEAGYSRNPDEIISNIKALSDLGVQGINIEDSLVNKTRSLVDVEAFSRTLEKVSSGLAHSHSHIFLNVRTDTFLLSVPDPVKETIKRAKLYQDAGADGIFVPCIEREEDISEVLAEIQLPLNVMCMPNLPDFSTLQKLGVSRISMGNFVFNKMGKQLQSTLSQILEEQSFQSLFR
ncbi:MAG: isocitrate lyase/phosphoenolpyruvate mutase family protein [Bacteroidota bacterium]